MEFTGNGMLGQQTGRKLLSSSITVRYKEDNSKDSNQLQSMNLKIFQPQYSSLILIIIAIFPILIINKCYNSTDFRYDLEHPVQIVNYNSICFEYSKRTCCSPSNLQVLAKKITKFIGHNLELSFPCRRRLTSLMCSPCDGDIGQNQYDGVCSGLCSDLYEACSQDLFSIDANNQLKACRQDDIICSPLESIVAEKGKDYICNLLELRSTPKNCWSGEVSARIRGKASKKITINPKKQTSHPPPPPGKKRSGKQEPWLSDSSKTYLALVVLLGLVLLYQFLRTKYRLWKRQIRNH